VNNSSNSGFIHAGQDIANLFKTKHSDNNSIATSNKDKKANKLSKKFILLNLEKLRSGNDLSDEQMGQLVYESLVNRDICIKLQNVIN